MTTKQQKRDLNFVFDWLEGISSPGKCGLQCSEEEHRAAVQAIAGYGECGIHGEIAAHNVAHVYRCLLLEFRMRPLSAQDVIPWLEAWRRMSELEVLTGNLKWLFCSFYSFCLGQPLPATPDNLRVDGKGASSTIFRVIPGKAGRFLRSVGRKLRAKIIACAPEALHSKSVGKALTIRFLAKGSAKVSDTEIAKALEKHRIALTEVDGFRPKDPIHKKMLGRLKWEVRRTVYEVFHGKTFHHREKPLFPSRKGHTNVSGVKGGAATRILQEFSACQRKLEGLGVCPRQGVAVSLDPCSEESQNSFAQRIKEGVEADLETMFATPIAIPEPLKTRVVTCGPEYAYWYLRDIQQFLWSTLKRHPCFSLIGEPITAEILRDRFVGCVGGKFGSGDYRDSTNCVLACLSRTCARAIADVLELSKLDSELLEKALVGHTLKYKKGKGKTAVTTFLKQINGQLMGSPVSFPILCLLNAALCRAALEGQDPDEDLDWADLPPKTFLSLRKAPLLVNGDDCLFYCPDSGFVLWEKWAKLSGMESSLGKTYFSSEFVQMNSTTYCVRHKPLPDLGEGAPTETIWFELVPYVNFGFLSPFDPKGGRPRTYRDLPALARELIRSFPPKKADTLMGWFLSSHRTLLRSIPEGMSYWLPTHLGGLGLPRTRELPPEAFTEMQLNFAEYLLHHAKDSITLPAEEKTVPSWVRAGERVCSRMRVRVPGEREGPVVDWGDERIVHEDEQFVYWLQAREGGLHEERESIVPASKGNFGRMRHRFIRSGIHQHSPVATLLTDPPPRMEMAPGFCDLTEARGFHPRGMYQRISSLVEGTPYVPEKGSKGRVLFVDDLVFEIFENHFLVRSARNSRYFCGLGVDIYRVMSAAGGDLSGVNDCFNGGVDPSAE